MSRTTFALTSISLAVATFAAACGGGTDNPPDAVPITACNDQVDNDGDLSTDYPADPGCASELDNDESNAPIAMCVDGRDNDGDGLTDYPNDPGCVSPLQNNEMDDCPSGPGCPACSNDMDDDGDGLIDYPMDAGCLSASHDDEYVTNPAACGTGLIVTRLDGDVAKDMFITAGDSNLEGSCGGVGSEVAYELVLAEPMVIIATTEDTATTGNTVLYLRDDCLDAGTELACNDDIDPSVNRASSIQVSLDAGVYYLIVDNHDQITAGAFTLHVDRFAGEGVACTTTAECGPGLVCRIPMGGTEMVCSEPVCTDGLDDDGDGTPDYPGDPGCGAPTDDTEEDDCPDGPMCPACANGLDDDGDTLIDYPMDPECSAASQNAEGCVTESDPFHVLASATHDGDLTGTTNDFTLTCGFSGGADEVYITTLPDMQQVRFDTEGSSFDTVLALYASDCTSSIGCDDDGGTTGNNSLLVLNNLAAGSYALVVAAYGSGTGGAYSLHTTGTIASGGRCDGALATAGVISCDTANGYACNGSGICVGTLQCNNGVDDDGDGLAGFPEDPGCTSTSDTDETDDCPSGPMCPQCANDLDDDGDLLIDYPADPSCVSASAPEYCPPVDTDPVTAITAPTTNGTTVGATSDFIATCQANSSSPDVMYSLTLPVGLTSLTANTNDSGWDTVLTLRTGDCATPVVACDDDSGTPGTESSLSVTNLAAGAYFLVVDGYNGQNNPFELHVAGVAVPGASCTSPLFAAGVLTCAPGETCTAGSCQ